MNQAVSIGDDGRPPGADDGPLLAALKTWFAELRDHHHRAMAQTRTELLQALQLTQPAYAPVKASGTIDANGNLALTLGGPQLGRRWAVRIVVFSDAGAYWNTMAGAVAVVASGQKPIGNTINADAVRWPFNACPNAATFGADELVITPADDLLLVISSGTAGQNIQATAWIQDYDPLHVRAESQV